MVVVWSGWSGSIMLPVYFCLCIKICRPCIKVVRSTCGTGLPNTRTTCWCTQKPETDERTHASALGMQCSKGRMVQQQWPTTSLFGLHNHQEMTSALLTFLSGLCDLYCAPDGERRGVGVRACGIQRCHKRISRDAIPWPAMHFGPRP